MHHSLSFTSQTSTAPEHKENLTELVITRSASTNFGFTDRFDSRKRTSSTQEIYSGQTGGGTGRLSVPPTAALNGSYTGGGHQLFSTNVTRKTSGQRFFTTIEDGVVTTASGSGFTSNIFIASYQGGSGKSGSTDENQDNTTKRTTELSPALISETGEKVGVSSFTAYTSWGGVAASIQDGTTFYQENWATDEPEETPEDPSNYAGPTQRTVNKIIETKNVFTTTTRTAFLLSTSTRESTLVTTQGTNESDDTGAVTRSSTFVLGIGDRETITQTIDTFTSAETNSFWKTNVDFPYTAPTRGISLLTAYGGAGFIHTINGKTHAKIEFSDLQQSLELSLLPSARETYVLPGQSNGKTPTKNNTLTINTSRTTNITKQVTYVRSSLSTSNTFVSGTATIKETNFSTTTSSAASAYRTLTGTTYAILESGPGATILDGFYFEGNTTSIKKFSAASTFWNGTEGETYEIDATSTFTGLEIPVGTTTGRSFINAFGDINSSVSRTIKLPVVNISLFTVYNFTKAAHIIKLTQARETLFRSEFAFANDSTSTMEKKLPPQIDITAKTWTDTTNDNGDPTTSTTTFTQSTFFRLGNIRNGITFFPVDNTYKLTTSGPGIQFTEITQSGNEGTFGDSTFSIEGGSDAEIFKTSTEYPMNTTSVSMPFVAGGRANFTDKQALFAYGPVRFTVNGITTELYSGESFSSTFEPSQVNVLSADVLTFGQIASQKNSYLTTSLDLG